MRTSTHRTVSQTLTNDDGREFPLPIEDTMGDPAWSAKISDLPDGRVLVSYLVVEGDDAGMNADDIIGNSFDYVILESQSDADALSERLNVCSICGEWRQQCEMDYDDHEFTNDDAQATRDGTAFFFEKYEHGLVRYALTGESSQVDRQWDVTPVAGWMRAKEDAFGPWINDPAERPKIEEAARATLEEYTSWCNGDVYGIVHATYRYEGDDPERADDGWVIDSDEDVESCWGYIGHDYAEQTLLEEHTWHTEKGTA